ncbi:MAG: hypothetical protein PUD50_06040 [Eubacteriales bacterium]|nr:hypothetical protein [Eubacteriales bacterium]
MKKVALAVIGATAAGIGAASERSDAIIFEKGMIPGADFGAAMYAAPYMGDKAAILFRECLDAGVMDADGRLHPSMLSPFLALRLKRSGAEVRLFARVLDVCPCEEGFALRFFDAEGLHVCIARQVLITTHDAQPGGQAQTAWKKYLCAQLCCAGGKEIHPARGRDWDIVRGTLNHERIFRVAIPTDADWPEARLRLHERWQAVCGCELAGWQIAAVASSFAYTFERPICRKLENGVWYLPSASLGNPVDAFCGGAACAINIG